MNKIDLPASDTEKVKKQIEDVIGIDTSRSINCSGKTGEGIDDILESIVKNLPPPKGNINNSLKSLLVPFLLTIPAVKDNTLFLISFSFGAVVLILIPSLIGVEHEAGNPLTPSICTIQVLQVDY